MTDYKIPTAVVGPGSQVHENDAADLSFIAMPAEMATYSMPDVKESISALKPANTILLQLQRLLDNYHPDNPVVAMDLSILDSKNLELIDQVLGEGEVSAVFSSQSQTRIQESVLAGVWRIQSLNDKGEKSLDSLEVADIPSIVREKTFTDQCVQKHIEHRPCPEGVNNAIPLLSEINDKTAQITDANRESSQAHVINLTLLPQSSEDIEFLSTTLGKGKATILSRGYGNCRVTSTATQNVWWVQYFNSQDAIILNTLEITSVPMVVCASADDIADSAQRLQEIRQVYA